jgi:PAS domain-containing protein
MLASTRDGRILFANVAATRLLGFSATELAAMYLLDLHPAFLKTLGYRKDDVLGRTAEELALFVQPDEPVAAAAELQAKGRITDVEMRIRSDLVAASCQSPGVYARMRTGSTESTTGYWCRIALEMTVWIAGSS